MNIDEILTEWCYRLPKGYPTVVNGIFTDKEEVRILNQILQENGLPTYKHEQKRLSESLTEEDFDNILNTNTLSNLDIGAKKIQGKSVQRLVVYASGISSSERKQLLLQIANDLNGEYVSKYSSAGAVEANYQGMPFYVLLKVLADDKTSINVKEGTPTLLAQVPDIEPATPETAVDLANKVIAAAKNNDIVGVDEGTRDEVLKFYTNMASKVAENPKILKQLARKLNESISQALSFKVMLDTNPDFEIDRASLFNDIRSAAQQITKLPADKWCPGDIYFIRKGSESAIRAAIQEALSRDNVEEAASILNSQFSTIEDFDQKVQDDHNIVAVSLKESKAQGGKLKSAFKRYEGTPEEYNITDEEFNYDKLKLRAGIERVRSILNKYIAANSDIDYIYNESNINQIEDEKTLRGKYAAYKAMEYITKRIAKVSDNLDDAFIGLVAYGFGIIQQGSVSINPPFLKLISDISGKPTKPQYFEPGRTMALLSLDGSDSPAQIEIRDAEKYAGLQVILTLLLVGAESGGDAKRIKYEMNFRYNGNKQITIELGRPREIT